MSDRTETTKQIMKLDEERREIQDRMQARAAIRRGKKEFVGVDGEYHDITQEVLQDLKAHDQYADSDRYIEIMDRQWAFMGATGKGPHQSKPYR